MSALSTKPVLSSRLLFMAAVLVLQGCGKKAPPVAPEQLRPRPVRAVQARNLATGIHLSWAAPKRRINNQLIDSLYQFMIYRVEGRTQAECSTQSAWRHVADVDATNDAETYGFLDENVTTGHWYAYRIHAMDRSGKVSDPSEGPIVYRGQPPPPAPAPALEPGDGFVALRMPSFPDDVVGWHLYRTAAGTDLRPTDESPKFVQDQDFTDAGLPNGVPVQYAVAWVRLDQGFAIEGPLSQPAVTSPRDLVPPPPPGTVVAVATESGVQVRWERVEEPDVRYHVYRRQAGEPGFRLVTPEPVAETDFTDTPPPGVYEYGVSSLDTAGNESTVGGSARVTVR